MEDKKKKIISAASRLLEICGSQFTMDQVAREAGVAKGTVYLYFNNKQELIKQVLLTSLEDLQDVLAAASKQHTHPDAQLISMLVAHYKLVAGKTPLIHRVMTSDPEIVQGIKEQVEPGLMAVEEQYVSVLQKGLESGVFQEHRPELVAPALLALVHNLAASCTAFRSHVNPEEVIEQVSVMVFNGLRRERSTIAFRNLLLEDSKTCSV